MASHPKTEIAQTLAKNIWFRRQPASLQAALAGAAIVTHAETGRWLYDAGDEAYGLYGVISGSVSIHMQMAQDDYALMNIVGPGTIFGYAARLVRRRRLVTAVVREDARLLFVSEPRLEAIAQKQPDLWLHFAELMSEHLLGAMRAMIANTRGTPTDRVAMHLRSLSGDGAGNRSISVTQDELAELTGLSRKTVNQVLAALAASGAIEVGYRRIDLIDVGKLMVALR